MDLFGMISFLVLVFPSHTSGVTSWQLPLDNSMWDSSRNIVSRDVVAFVSGEKRSLNTDCPEIYRRYSTQHVFCLKSTCSAEQRPSLQKLKDSILRMHNELRSSLVRGTTTHFSQFPRAANMMELEWDDELARLAAAEAKLCPESLGKRPKKDVAVGNFSSIGQILHRYEHGMNDFMKHVKFKEAKAFVPGYINPFHLTDDYEHFTQVVWAESWKVGCGEADVGEGDSAVTYFICNYGPKGNIEGKELYKPGKPCSQCPKNTECSKDYPGLCKSKTSDGPQIDRPPIEDFILYCDFSEDDPIECSRVIITGDSSFTTKHTYSGNYKTVVLSEGEEMDIRLVPVDYAGGFCPFLYVRAGPDNAADHVGPGLAIAVIGREHSSSNHLTLTGSEVSDWFTFHGLTIWEPDALQVEIQLSVQKGFKPQYYDIKAWGIRKGPCKDFMKQ